MPGVEAAVEYRLLVVDDTASMHSLYKTVFAPKRDDKLGPLEDELFGSTGAVRVGGPAIRFVVDSANQGREAVDLVSGASRAGKPYALICMDVRMPPGLNGIDTVSRIWALDPNPEVIFVTAYSDHNLEEITQQLRRRDRFLILKKPFDTVVLLQMVYSLTEKWRLRGELERQLALVREDLRGLADPRNPVERGAPSEDLHERLRETQRSLKDVVSKLARVGKE